MGNLAEKNGKILIILQKCVLKQAFRRGEELEKEVVQLSNIFSNRLDDLVDSSDKEDVINCRQNRNATSLQLPAIRSNRIASYFEPKKWMKGAKGDTSDISFLYQGIIKCN